MLKGILIGIVLGILGVFIGVYLYFASGHAPVATKGPEMPFEHKFAHMAIEAYLDKLPHPKTPIPEDEKNYLAGAEAYRQHCAVCHGLPGDTKTAIADGMFPRPPQLFRGTGVTDDETWETYWKISDGIRMTGMPGFKEHLDETKMWQLSILLKNADKLSPAVKAALAGVSSPAVPEAAPAAGAPAAGPTTAPAGTAPANH